MSSVASVAAVSLHPSFFDKFCSIQHANFRHLFDNVPPFQPFKIYLRSFDASEAQIQALGV